VVGPPTAAPAPRLADYLATAARDGTIPAGMQSVDSDRDGTEGNPWALDLPPGGWYRGNLHCHTTNSDGRLSPQETVDWFAGAGYHFLALTDHGKITDPAALDGRGMCLLPATELTATGGELGASYHLLALGVPARTVLPPPSAPARESVAWLHQHGAVVFVAHPHWSGLTVADIASLPSGTVAGIEIFNGGTVLDSHKGEAVVHWDEGLARGHRWWGIAVDDTHWHSLDRGLGWVMVRAPECTPAALLRALARGHFYASSGPQIRRLSVRPEPEGLLLEVETSPCAIIYALGYGSRNQFAVDGEAIARGERGTTITTATFHVRKHVARVDGRPCPAPYVRVQCVDWQRRSAWSNPLFL